MGYDDWLEEIAEILGYDARSLEVGAPISLRVLYDARLSAREAADTFREGAEI